MKKINCLSSWVTVAHQTLLLTRPHSLYRPLTSLPFRLDTQGTSWLAELAAVTPRNRKHAADALPAADSPHLQRCCTPHGSHDRPLPDCANSDNDCGRGKGTLRLEEGQ
jgi:hypothetical protein